MTGVKRLASLLLWPRDILLRLTICNGGLVFFVLLALVAFEDPSLPFIIAVGVGYLWVLLSMIFGLDWEVSGAEPSISMDEAL